MLKIPLFLLFFCAVLGAKSADLTPTEACGKIDEILHAHAVYHTLNNDLMSRTLQNFCLELDPNYCYLLEDEVVRYNTPKRVLKEVQKGCFATFEKIHDLFLASIARRRQLEESVQLEPLPDDVSHEEFQEMSWTKTEEELKTRLRRVRALQLKTAQKFAVSHFEKRLEKQRVRREEAMLTRKGDHAVLTYVLKAFAAALDSQTAYFTPSEASQLRMHVQKKLFGIGAQLTDDLDGLTIVRILEDSPLSRMSEVEIGDRIIAVGGEPIIGLDISEAVDLIRGPEGTPVTLTFLRKETAFDVQITRGAIVLKESRLETHLEPFGSGMIATLTLHSFYQDEESSSALDLQRAIEKLQKEHRLSGIILDLRNNTGGLLPQAVSVAGLFMQKGVVVSIKDNTGFIQRLRTLQSAPTWKGPLLILTNKLTASASEIVAQTLQEYGLALTVGDEETFGKGTFQTFTLESSHYGPVNTQGEYKVTRGCYYTVSGKTPQKSGMHPHIVVPGHFASYEIGERFAKYPLEPDAIPSAFDDDLSDIPWAHRAQIAQLYKTELQPVVTTYESYLPQLVGNSARRHDDSNKNLNSEELDGQLIEAVNIMKDVLYLMP